MTKTSTLSNRLTTPLWFTLLGTHHFICENNDVKLSKSCSSLINVNANIRLAKAVTERYESVRVGKYAVSFRHSKCTVGGVY